MKTIFLTFCLIATAQSVFADLCSKTPPGFACTPDPGAKTDEAKSAILELIKRAQKDEATVKKLEAKYLAVRNNSQASSEEKFAACKPFYYAQIYQNNLYREAIRQTENLYHVHPDDQSLITIGQPDEPDKSYVAGLSAIWNPKVTDSGPGIKLSARIDGSDGRPHYSGATEMDPSKPNGRQAITLADGRVFILKDTFEIAVKKKNLGFLAHVLYHETRHFNQLSWKDKTGKNRGWAVPDERERDAYKADARMGRIFGLSQTDIDGLEAHYREYADAVKNGQPITDDHLTPTQEAVWKEHYEQLQINLEDEYAELQLAVEDEKARLLEMQARQRKERERVERERLAQEQAEKERQKAAVWAEIEAAAAACDYQVSYQGHTGKFMGFRGENEYLSFNERYKTEISMNDISIMLLVGRSCHDVEDYPERASARACNGAASMLAAKAAQSEFPAKRDYLFGPKPSGCIKAVLDNAGAITDSASLEKVIANFKKMMIEEKREHDRNYPRTPDVKTPSGGGRSREPGGSGSGSGKAYIWDPGCSCWAREQ